MANDIFLEITGIKGESTDAQHTGQIDVMAWSWAVSNPGSFHKGQGGGSGTPKVGDMVITKPIDASSTELFKACMTGRHIDRAKLWVRKAGGKPLEFFQITLTKVLVNNVVPGMIEADGRLSERVTLHFAEMKVEYTTQTATGGKGDYYSMSHQVTRCDPNAASPGALPFYLWSKKPNPASQTLWTIDRSSYQQHATPWMDSAKANDPATWAGLPGFGTGSLAGLAQYIRSQAPTGQPMFRVEAVSMQGKEYLSRYKTDLGVNTQLIRLCELLPTGHTQRNLAGMRVSYAAKQEAGKSHHAGVASMGGHTFTGPVLSRTTGTFVDREGHVHTYPVTLYGPDVPKSEGRPPDESNGFWAAENANLLAGQIASGVKFARYAHDPFFGLGGWKGKNGIWYSQKWGGNGATGGRLKFAAESSEVAGKIGRGLFFVGAAFSAAHMAEGLIDRDYNKAVLGAADLGAGVLGEFGGPLGWAFSGGYFTGRLIDDTFGVSDHIAQWITGYP